MTEPLQFYYVRSILGCWVPEASAMHPEARTRDGRKIDYAHHRWLDESDTGMSLTRLAAKYPPPASAPQSPESGFAGRGGSKRDPREMIRSLAMLLDGCGGYLEREASDEKRREAGKAMRQISAQERSRRASELVHQAFAYLGEDHG